MIRTARDFGKLPHELLDIPMRELAEIFALYDLEAEWAAEAAAKSK